MHPSRYVEMVYARSLRHKIITKQPTAKSVTLPEVYIHQQEM